MESLLKGFSSVVDRVSCSGVAIASIESTMSLSCVMFADKYNLSDHASLLSVKIRDDYSDMF